MNLLLPLPPHIAYTHKYTINVEHVQSLHLVKCNVLLTFSKMFEIEMDTKRKEIIFFFELVPKRKLKIDSIIYFRIQVNSCILPSHFSQVIFFLVFFFSIIYHFHVKNTHCTYSQFIIRFEIKIKMLEDIFMFQNHRNGIYSSNIVFRNNNVNFDTCLGGEVKSAIVPFLQKKKYKFFFLKINLIFILVAQKKYFFFVTKLVAEHCRIAHGFQLP